jgi:hypothetical protein
MHSDLLELPPAIGLPEDLRSALGPDEALIEAERCLECGGPYRLTHVPPERVPIEEWLKLQGRFAHLMAPEHEAEVAEIQRRVDQDRDALVAKCAPA